jgi:hypothetical protein
MVQSIRNTNFPANGSSQQAVPTDVETFACQSIILNRLLYTPNLLTYKAHQRNVSNSQKLCKHQVRNVLEKLLAGKEISSFI